MCGRTGHLRSNCRLHVHPDFNKNGKWNDSEAGKKVSELKFDTRLNGDKFDFDAAKKAAEGSAPAKTTRKDGPPDKKKHKSSKCKDICMCIYKTNNIDIDRVYVLNRYNNIHESFNHTVLATIHANNITFNIHVLLDTGALQSNYVCTKLAGWLESNNVKKVDSKLTKVCTAFNECKVINYSFYTKISFLC